MKTYNRKRPGSAKLRRIMLRILYVIAVAAVITCLSIMLGFHLQKKVDEAEKKFDSYLNNSTVFTQDDSDENSVHRVKAPEVFGSSLILTDYKSTETVDMNVKKLSGYFDTLMIPVTDNNGTLFYASDALQALVMQPAVSDNPFSSRMKEAIASAKENQMRLCALYTPARVFSETETARLIDGALFSELFSLGFDEILLDCQSLCNADLTVEDTQILRSYLLSNSERINGNGLLGLLLPSELYENTSAAKQVQMLATAVSFLGIGYNLDNSETTAEIYRSVSSSILSLYGSFNAYHMRVIIPAAKDKTVITAAYGACIDNNINNICFASTVSPENLDYTPGPAYDYEGIEEQVIDTEEETEFIYEINPYASTSEDYAENNSDDETDDMSVSSGIDEDDISSRRNWY